MQMHHYTDKPGYNGIRSTPDWLFKASQPPGDHPFGAYFTTYGPATKNLALRLRVPREKIEYVFVFRDVGDLIRLRGRRGDFILYSPGDYLVEGSRKIDSGESPIVEARLASERETP
jgi:hypothetical protein